MSKKTAAEADEKHQTFFLPSLSMMKDAMKAAINWADVAIPA